MTSDDERLFLTYIQKIRSTGGSFGHQVLTSHGKLIDILGIDVEGMVHIVELKRDMTSRAIVAQALDYASWVQGLSNEDLRDIFSKHQPGRDFDTAFAERFGGTPQQMTLMRPTQLRSWRAIWTTAPSASSNI